MRVAYLDCFAGIAGDMFLGALVQAGVPIAVLEEAAKALNIGATLRHEHVDRSGISSVKIHVLENGQPADSLPQSHTHEAHSHETGQAHLHQHSQDHDHKHSHDHTHSHDHGHTHSHEHAHDHTHSHEHGHKHDHEHSHEHTHDHVHGRSLTEIRRLITAAPLAQAVKDFALRTFTLLGESEARIHNVPVDSIHFHEVGAVDAIVDIVCASAGIHHLRIDRWYCSPVNIGGGMVDCAHGRFPVPAPATADLLRGIPTYSADIQKELVTPTGAALLRALNPEFGPQPAMSATTLGYGAGTRNPKGFPNVLRLTVGEAADRQPETENPQGEQVAVLETALDDLSPQLLGYVTEKALADGALDVMLTPVIMKKGRPGTLLTLLCEPADSARFTQLLLTETSTLGVRMRIDSRACLERAHVVVQTTYGEIRIKVASQNGSVLNAAPEFEDCRAAAMQHQVALKQVQQAALAAYLSQKA